MADTARDILRRITIDEDLALRLNDLHFLLGNGSADVVCLTHGIAAQRAENLNDLLLIDNTAIGNF